MTRVLIVPGLGGSGPEHWQSRWQALDACMQRVEQSDWDAPDYGTWCEQLDQTVCSDDTPVVFVAHGLGCALVVRWAHERHEPSASDRPIIVGALLVAPADVDDRAGVSTSARGFAPMPIGRLPFPALVVASTEDPFVDFRRASSFAESWGAPLMDAGPMGHLNSESGLGTWSRGRALLDTLLRTAPFALDRRLRSDTLLLGKSKLNLLLLMNDRRYPWLILVPRRAGICEVFQLEHTDRLRLEEESGAVASALLSAFEADKVNVAVLGNIVRQLHVHHVARFLGDPAWPGPVWGHSPREPYEPHELDQVIAKLRSSELAAFFNLQPGASWPV